MPRTQHGIWAGVCGEMAGDPVLAPLLLGLGVDELSAAPPVVPQVKYIIRRLKLSEAQALAEFALQCESPAEILARCQELARADRAEPVSKAKHESHHPRRRLRHAAVSAHPHPTQTAAARRRQADD